MKKICLVLPLLFSITFNAIAQKQAEQKINIDSLIGVALKDSMRINFGMNKDSLLRLLPSAKTAAKRIKLVYQIIDYGRDLSARSLQYHYKILEWSRKHNDPVIEAIITAELGFSQYSNGDNVIGIKNCIAAVKMAEKTKNAQAIAIVYDNLENCTTDKNEALKYGFKTLHFSRIANDTLFVGYALNNLSTAYLALQKKDSARYYAVECLKWSVEKRHPILMPDAVLTLADFEEDKRQLGLMKSAETMARNAGDNYQVSQIAVAIGSYYYKRNKVDSALYYAHIGYNLAKNGGSLGLILKPTALLAKIFEKRRADSTLRYTVEYYTLRDSVRNVAKTLQAQAIIFNDEQARRDAEAKQAAYETTVRYYAMAAAAVFLLILAIILWRNNRKRKQANELLQEQRDQVQETLDELEATQNQLIQSEKMASLGELTAGIAHEIQNPLNFVNNFSEVSIELVDEMAIELTKGDKEEAKAIASDIKQNLEKIRFHGGRADGIVKGMLQHSRTGSGAKELTDLNNLADESLRLAYHGLRAKDKLFNADMVTHFDAELPKINIVPQDISRVLINLFNNAFYAVRQRQKKAGRDYLPTVEVSTSLFTNPTGGQGVYIRVKDNGTGIPEDIREKIMQPFFTTKPTGQGTGLGLSLSYDIIVKGHNGKINVDSEVGEYTEFAIWLPLKK